MKVRNTIIIKFNLVEQKATIKLTPLQTIEVDKDSIFAHHHMSGWIGWHIIQKNNMNKGWSISGRVMRQIAKYLEFTEKDFDYDYFRMPFEKLVIH